MTAPTRDALREALSPEAFALLTRMVDEAVAAVPPGQITSRALDDLSAALAVAPTRDDGLRAALDAHEKSVTYWPGTEAEAVTCRCGWSSVRSDFKTWDDHREAAVRAALAPMASEPDGGLAFALEWVSNASHIATCSWERGGKDCDCGRKETLAILNLAATPQPPAAPVAGEGLREALTTERIEAAMETAGAFVQAKGGPMIEHHDEFVRVFRDALLAAAPPAPAWPAPSELIVAAVKWSRSNPPERARLDFALRGRIAQWLYDARQATGIEPDDAILAALAAPRPEQAPAEGEGE